MKTKIVAFIEKDLETNSYVAIVPGLPEAHAQASVSLCELTPSCGFSDHKKAKRTLESFRVKLADFNLFI